MVCGVHQGNFVKFGSYCVENRAALKEWRLRESEDTVIRCRNGLRKQIRTKTTEVSQDKGASEKHYEERLGERKRSDSCSHTCEQNRM